MDKNICSIRMGALLVGVRRQSTEQRKHFNKSQRIRYIISSDGYNSLSRISFAQRQLVRNYGLRWCIDQITANMGILGWKINNT